MPADSKKGITVKVDAELHAEVRQYLEDHGMTMSEFVSLALADELHPKIQMKEDMGSMRTLAFQVPDDLFRRIKEYLQRNNMTQKEFMIGLIENELTRDLAEREAGKSLAEQEDHYEAEDTPNEEAVFETDAEAPAEDAEDALYEETSEDEAEEDGMNFAMGM